MSENNNKLNRAIGAIGIGALAINGLIGAGIFALPAGAAMLSGNMSPWMFLLCALLMSVVVLSFAQLSKGFAENGGPVAYTHKAFGNHVAFQTTWLLYVGRLTALAANTNAILLYISFFFPTIQSPLLSTLTIILIMGLLLYFNLKSAGQAIGIINALTLLKLVPLLLFIGVGLFYFDTEKVFSIDTSQISDIDATLLLIVYAYVGFEGAVVPAGESKKPQQIIARALISTLLFTTLLYFLVQSISLSVLPELAHSKAPLSDAATIFAGNIGAVVITFAAILSITGNLSAIVFTAPRMTFALSQQGNLPQWFGRLSLKSKAPINSITFLVVLAMVLAITGSFIWLAIVSSLARLIGYFIAIGALIKLRGEFVKNNSWFLPAGISVPLAALVVCLWLSINASLSSWLLTMVFILFGSALFKFSHKRQQNHTK